jgi:hypothetical protein
MCIKSGGMYKRYRLPKFVFRSKIFWQSIPTSELQGLIGLIPRQILLHVSSASSTTTLAGDKLKRKKLCFASPEDENRHEFSVDIESIGYIYKEYKQFYTLTTYQLHELHHHNSWSWALLEKLPMCSHSRNSQHFMEPEGSLPCSQEPSTGPYPEPDQSNLYHPILSL